jgi:Cu+-exporting ATPase
VGRLAVLRARLAVARHRNLNMFTLIALGTGVAYGYSVVATLAPGSFPAAFPRPRRRGRGLFRGGRGHHRAGAARPGAGAARPRATSGAIRALLDLAPKTARASAPTAPRRGRRRSTRSRSATGCACGPARRCRSTASSSRAARRRRIDGHRRVDAGHQGAGAKVIGGTLNQHGGFVMRAEKVGATPCWRDRADGGEAQRSRAPIQRLADQVAGWFVPAVIAVALLAFAAWAIFGPEPRFAYGLVARSAC